MTTPPSPKDTCLAMDKMTAEMITSDVATLDEATAVEESIAEPSSACVESLPTKVKGQEELPAEILETIVDFLVNHNLFSILLNFRGTEWRWKKLVNKLMEKEYSTTFELFNLVDLHHPDEQNHWIHSPKLRLSSTTLSDVWCPNCVVDCTDFATENYKVPTSSLVIDSSSLAPEREPDFTQLPVTEFLSRFATNLTYLSIFDVNYKLEELSKILECTPNLRGLAMSNMCCGEALLEFVTVTMPKISTLKIIKLTNHTVGQKACRYHMMATAKIIYPYLKQLTHLTLSEDNCSVLTHLERDKHQLELKELVLSNANENFFTQTRILFAPLKHLVIHKFRCELYENAYFQQIWEFAELFAETLTYLHLDVDMQMIQLEGEDRSFEFEVSFPKVKTLALPFPLLDACHVVIEDGLLQQFPTLEKLQFLETWEERSTIVTKNEKRYTTDLIKPKKYWRICETLKVIEVYPNTHGSFKIFREV